MIYFFHLLGLKMPVELSKSDIEILKMVQSDATLTTAAIAEKINLSQSPCWRRVNRLEQEGLITRRVAVLDRQALGMDVVVFATINLTSTGRQNLLEFEQEIVRHPEVMECYTMTGIWDYMIKIVTRDIRHYEAFVRNTLTTSPSIRELHSHVAVTEIKNSTELPLDTQLQAGPSL
ncbi:MAG: Lrp/AsnC family transcriptional regulator [Halieaceae bacterium]|jgi:Lrp/AsnC family transcriptional regulator